MAIIVFVAHSVLKGFLCAMLRHLIFPERPLIVNGIELAIFPRLVAEIGVGREEKLILDVSE